MSFSRKRQRFLVNQGYAYKVVTKLTGMDTDAKLHYKTRDEQVLLLQQVLAAADADIDESEDRFLAAAGGSGGGIKRKAGNMASMSGADDNVYLESRSKSSAANKHPLFKKFRAGR